MPQGAPRPAGTLADARADLDVYWHEDPIATQHLDNLARYGDRVRGSLTGSENLGTRVSCHEAFGRGAIDVAHFNMACTGGLTEGRKLAALADNFERAIVPHDCTGPGLLVANTHQVFAAENALILRTVRAHDRRYCCGPVTRAAADRARLACPMDGAGLGATLRPELRSRSDVAIRRSSS